MVTVLHLMPRRFHQFIALKKNFGNQTSLATISILQHNNCTSYFKIDRIFTELQVAEYSKHCKSQFQAVVIQSAAGETKFGKCEK